MRYPNEPAKSDCLEVFRNVATEGSITKAALKLNCVQSNVSTRIKQLETQLGRRLFHRHNQGLDLTEDGHRLLVYAERYFQLSRETIKAFGNDHPTGTFRIGTMESTAATRLPALLSRYHQLYPDVEIELKTDTAGGLVERLQKRKIDTAFVAEPISFDWAQLRSVFVEKLVLLAPKSFPPIPDASHINGKTIIAFETGCAYRRYLEQWLLQSGVVPGNVMSVSSYLAILACVSAGAGYAVVPQSVLDVVASKGEFQQYDLPEPFSAIKTQLVWREDYDSPNLSALKELLPD